jgi:hypothetical protein
MKTYYIEAPVVLKLMVGVEAESKEEAKVKLLNARIGIDVKDDGDTLDWVHYEWELLEQVVQGNVYYGGINEIEIEEEDE